MIAGMKRDMHELEADGITKVRKGNVPDLLPERCTFVRA